jgi:hypothetical protein
MESKRHPAMSQADLTKQRKEQVAQLRALAGEIASAIAAIEKNDLSALVSHIAAQQSICDRLGSARIAFSMAGNKSSEPFRELQKAQAELAYMNKVYKAVVKRAQKTTALIAGIYRAHAQGYGKGASSAAKHQTWSCEV